MSVTRAESGAIKSKRKSFTIGSGVRGKHVTEFTRQFATLNAAGLPIVRALDIMQNQLPPGTLKGIVGDVRDDVSSGSSLSEGMSKHPAAFGELYVNMVRAGEISGALDTILLRLADFREKAEKLRRRIIGAMVYPTAVISIAVLILTFLMIFIIPKFQKLFHDLGVDLPAPTRLLIFIAGFMVNYWYVLLGTPFLLFGIYVFMSRDKKGRRIIDNIKLRLPIFGQIVRKGGISNFCRTLGTLVQSGVAILDALAIIKGATGNEIISDAVGKIHDSIKEGDSIANPMADSGVFDDIVVNMVQVGEETGELDAMLMRIADNFDEQVNVMVESLMSLLEPLLIVGMGIAVGFIVISLFLPLVKMIQTMGKNNH
ncbi:MAG: type II secretion system F family protein [Planctomycetota bacterium]